MKQRIRYGAIIIAILLAFSSCGETPAQNNSSDSLIIGGNIKMVESQNTASPYSDGIFHDSRYYDVQFVSAQNCTYFSGLVALSIDASPEAPKLICSDPLCAHKYSEGACVSTAEFGYIAPIGDVLYLARGEKSTNKIYRYNTETLEYEMYAEFSNDVSRIFALGRYLYVQISHFELDENNNIAKSEAEYIRIDTSENTATSLYKLPAREIYGDLCAYKGEFYYIEDSTLMTLDVALEPYEYITTGTSNLDNGCREFEIHNDKIYYLPSDEAHMYELWEYDMTTGKEIKLLDDVYRFTVLNGQVYTHKYRLQSAREFYDNKWQDDNTYEYDNEIVGYGLTDLYNGEPLVICRILPPEGAYFGGTILRSGQGSLYSFLAPIDHDPGNLSCHGEFRYHIEGDVWHQLMYDYITPFQ